MSEQRYRHLHVDECFVNSSKGLWYKAAFLEPTNSESIHLLVQRVDKSTLSSRSTSAITLRTYLREVAQNEVQALALGSEDRHIRLTDTELLHIR